MQIKFEGQYDKKLFFRAVALANRPPKNRQRLLSILLVIAIGAIGVIAYRLITTGDLVGNLVYLAATLFMGGYVTFIFLRPYSAASKLWSNPGVRRSLKGTVDSTGIHYVFGDQSIDISWKDIYRPQMTNDLVTIIRRNDGLLLIFPQHFIKGKNNWQKFCQLVEMNVTSVGEKGIQRPARSK
jgi:hypothetical protein